MITLDPIEMGRMSDDEFDDAERNERIRRETLAAMADGGLPEMPGLDAPVLPEARPEQGRPITGGTAYPPGTVPPRDPVTAARGAEDIYGPDPMGGADPAHVSGQAPSPVSGQAPSPVSGQAPSAPELPGAGRRLAAPRPELLAALQQRRQAPPSRQAEAPPNLPGAPREERPMPSPSPSPGPRAKAGPPSQERDYTGVDVADAIARPFRAIGRGFSAFAGRQSGEMSSWGEQARARDRAADASALAAEQARARMGGEAQDRDLAERRVGVAERSQASTEERQRALTEAGITREDRMARIQERANELRAQGLEASAALTRARMEDVQAQRTERAAMQDPESDTSARARERLTRELQMLSQASGQQFDISPEGMSAVDVEAMERHLGVPRHVRQRATGSGGGGGGAQSAEAIRALAREAGLSETEVSAYGTSRRDMERLRTEAEMRMRGRARTGGGEGGVELVPGVFGADYVGVPEARAFRQHHAEAGQAMDALAELEGVIQRYGAQAVIDPRIASQVAPAVMRLRGMAAATQGSGTINEGEVPVINAAIPDPTSLRGSTLGDLQANVRAWRASVESGVARRAQGLGVDESSMAALLAGVRRRGGSGGGAPARQGAPPAAGRQRVRLPSGRTTQPLTPEQVRQALERFPGAEVL